jgi:tetratricopeptide (TPR) repeat protein
VILTRLGKYEEAIKDLEDAVREAPTGLHHFHLARAYRLAGRLKDAADSRKAAKIAGLTLEGVDATERKDFRELLEATKDAAPKAP